jgi:hypothetical protein
MGLSEAPLFLDLEAFLATVKNQEGFGKGREDNGISGERNPAVLLSLKEKGRGGGGVGRQMGVA